MNEFAAISNGKINIFSRYTRVLKSITKQKDNQLATINWIKQDLKPIERKHWFMQNTMDQLSLILKCFFIIDIHIQYIFIITKTHFWILMYPDISPKKERRLCMNMLLSRSLQFVFLGYITPLYQEMSNILKACFILIRTRAGDSVYLYLFRLNQNFSEIFKA